MKGRYARNIKALSLDEATALHTKKVCVIGCGGLGGYIIEILARIGVGYITAVDYDVFEENNLNRQILSTEKQLGVYKTEAAVRRIAEVNSDITINGLNVKFDKNNGPGILKGHDIVMDALDNIETRLLVSKICNNLNIPLVHGSIGGWYGQVATIFPGDNTMETIYQNSKKGIELELGNLPFTVSTTASLQCAECIKVLSGKGEVLRHSLCHINLLENEFHVIKLM